MPHCPGRNTTCSVASICSARARTATDAERYFQSYEAAIHRVGKACSVRTCEKTTTFRSSCQLCIRDLPRVRKLNAFRASRQSAHARQTRKSYSMGMSLDAEECSRLELSMDVFEWLCNHQDLADWNGLGFVLQAYQKRSIAVAQWLVELASNRPLIHGATG